MEKVLLKYRLTGFLVLVHTLLFGFQVHAVVPYDHGFTRECLAKPLGPQYDGGIVVNPELNQGLKGWTSFGGAKIENRQSQDGNNYLVASNRKQSFDSSSHKFNLDKEKLYTFSAWLQVSQGNALISAILKTQNDYNIAGWVTAQEGCWSMLKGGLFADASSPAELYFESNNTKVDIWVDSVSLQPFTQQEWKSHQDSNIEKVRKRRVKIQAVDEQGRPISNATVSIRQTQPEFPFGCAMNNHILKNTAYQNWFTSRFKYTVFENEMKWYSTEVAQGSENYSDADAMLDFAKAHNISVRGHNVFWDDQNSNPSWVPGLSSSTLRAAADGRIKSVVQRNKGKVFHWDVVNENMHYSFFEDKLGKNASAIFYGEANKIDPNATPFLNEFNTLENTGDQASLPTKYMEKISQIRQQGYGGPLGIGLEGHFVHANLPYVRSAIDVLASLGLPIWITELDVASGPNQVVYLEQLLRELHSHPNVRGMLVWGAWNPEMKCYRMCLLDKNFNNLPTGDVVDKMINELTHKREQLQGKTDSNGYFGSSLFHGEYEVKIIHPTGPKSLGLQNFNVVPNKNQGPLHIKIKA